MIIIRRTIELFSEVFFDLYNENKYEVFCIDFCTKNDSFYVIGWGMVSDQNFGLI